MKIYEKGVVQEKWEINEDAKEYSFDISEELLKKFESKEDVFRYLNRLKENKSIYSVKIQPNRSLRFRNDEVGVFFREKKAEYKKNYDFNLAERFAKDDTEKEYLSDKGIAKHKKIKPQYNYYITIFSKGLSGLLQQLFISTLVYAECGEKWPEGIDKESFVFQFDTKLKKATLLDINIYNPDNPFNKYMRKSMSVVRRHTFQETKNDDVDIIDYYIDNKITPWYTYDEKEFEEQMKREDNTLGVYMLYDSQKGYFYIGKAEKVYTRMQQHRYSNEVINKFDYYRYSLVEPIYYEDIFLIENAAIHDCAMIFNMKNNLDYRENTISLILPEGKDIKEVTMLNSVKKQTKRPQKR